MNVDLVQSAVVGLWMASDKRVSFTFLPSFRLYLLLPFNFRRFEFLLAYLVVATLKSQAVH